MLLLHRLTPFAIGLITACGFSAVMVMPSAFAWFFGVMFIAVAFLFARLLGFAFQERDHRELIFTPLIFLLSADFLFILFETSLPRLMAAVSTALFLFFYAEHLFRFLHLPAAYQTHGLQNTAQVMNLLTLFFVSAAAFGFPLFLHIGSLFMVFFWLVVSFFVLQNSFWAVKIPHEKGFLYSLCGAAIFAELFGAIVYLPFTYPAAGAVMTLMAYVFLGVSRAHLLLKLTGPVMRRYVWVGALGLIVIIGTSYV
jgi:hypothetical protein